MRCFVRLPSEDANAYAPFVTRRWPGATKFVVINGTLAKTVLSVV